MRVLPETVDPIREGYYRTCAQLLSAIGLWPFENKTVSRVKNIMLGHVIVLSIVSQIFILKSVTYSLDRVLEQITITLAGFGVALKYFTFCLMQEDVKLLLDTSICDWRWLKNEEELEIIKKYTMRGKFQAILFSMVVCPSGVCVMLIPFSSVFLDLIIPLNESRPVQFPIMYISTLDKDRYFSFNVVGSTISVLVSGISFIGTESIFLMFCQHACGLFAVASHRFEKAIAHADLNHEKSEEWTCQDIAEAVRMQIRATSFSENLSRTFGCFYLVLLCFGVLNLSICLYRLTYAILLFDDIVELMTAALFSVSILQYMFFLNYIIQKVADQSVSIFTAIYSTRWYKAPLSVQRLLLFILLRSIKPVSFNLVGVYSPSIEGFSSTAQLSLSYFMVLFSYQSS